MSIFETAQVAVPCGQRCEDRVAVFNSEDRTIIVVADGAGGTGDGHVAAETVVREIANAYGSIRTAEQWQAVLQTIDCRSGAGEATAVVVDLRREGMCGASAGDSQAWIVFDGEICDLTARQVRKPLLGSGNVQAAGFVHGPLQGTLIVATDGFCNYIKRQELPRLLSAISFPEMPRRCVELVRLPSGDLWDDIGIVACRVRPAQRSRQRYAI